MNIGTRILHFFLGILIILLAVVMILVPDDGIVIVAGLLSTGMFLYGIRFMYFYFTMARHMVGGKLMLCLGIILLDLGAFFYSISDLPKIYVVLYLVGIHAFAGLVGVLRALEAKKLEAKTWRLRFVSGLINILIAVLCVIFLGSIEMIVDIYSAGLIYSGIIQIVNAFRRTAVAYVR